MTGQLVATFRDNPQLPFSRFVLRFKSGPRAPLAMPQGCGPKTTTAVLTPWSGGPAKTVTSTFNVDCPGLTGFSPGSRPVPRCRRPGRSRRSWCRSRGPTVRSGSTACGSSCQPGRWPACVASRCAGGGGRGGACDGGSRVGSAAVSAGTGSNLFTISGQPVYLAGPYKGAPYSLSVAVRAVAGPLDLGTVVVRQALFIDPIDAHVHGRLRSVADDHPGYPAAGARHRCRRRSSGLHAQPDLVLPPRR